MLMLSSAAVFPPVSCRFCFENFIQARQLRRAQDVRKQLSSIMERYHLQMESCGKHWNRVQKAVCSGYFVNAAKKVHALAAPGAHMHRAVVFCPPLLTLLC